MEASLKKQKESVEKLIKHRLKSMCQSMMDLIDSTDFISEESTAIAILGGRELSTMAPDLADKDKVTLAYLKLNYLPKSMEEFNAMFDRSWEDGSEDDIPVSEPLKELTCWVKGKQ